MVLGRRGYTVKEGASAYGIDFDPDPDFDFDFDFDIDDDPCKPLVKYAADGRTLPGSARPANPRPLIDISAGL